jgi:hypothetical protein
MVRAHTVAAANDVANAADVAATANANVHERAAGSI